MKIGILGATGQAGRAIAKWLVNTEIADVVLIGRNREKLGRLQRSLAPLSSHPPTIAEADAADRQSLETVFRDLDMAVIAVSSPQYLPVITDAAQNTGTDCMDTLLGSAQKKDFLASRRESFEKHGMIYITDGGYHPGVPAALIRCAETVCPGLHTAAVYGSFGIDWDKLGISFDTIVDFVQDICTMDMGILQDGNWVSDWHNMRKFDFRDGRGVKDCVPMGMEEIRELPQCIPSIRNAGFFIAGFGRVTDWIIIPCTMVFLKLFPHALSSAAHFFSWGLKTFGSSGKWARLCLEGKGAQGSISLTLSYPDAYELTALPVVACLKQYVQRERRKPGLYRQALYVDPCRFISDLSDMGVEITPKDLLRHTAE